VSTAERGAALRYNSGIMNFRRLTAARAALAVVSTCGEETVIWAVWRFLLPALGANPSRGALYIAMAAWLVVSISIFTFTTRFLKHQKPAGRPTMLGASGTAASDLAPRGMVRIQNELWSATAEDGGIRSGEPVVVVGEKRMKLTVRRRDAGATR
jgi:membrane protein implicated in regulation of membrane protease activity